MRRPPPKSINGIKHPGPKAEDRRPHVTCRADPVSVSLAAETPLLTALGKWAEQNEFSSAVLDLSGLMLAPFDYVMPDRAIDDRHAAWYSDTKISSGARLSEAVAILGTRDGDWFAHIHAYWHEDGTDHLGHLLPHTLTMAEDTSLSGYGIRGASFDALPDPETEFTLFRVRPDQSSFSPKPDNALIATLAPFEDLHTSVEALLLSLSSESADIMGLGSLAGAAFRDEASMTGLISEILLRPEVRLTRNRPLSLPLRCIDLNGNLHTGTAEPGTCPTLVTCELLLVAK